MRRQHMIGGVGIGLLLVLAGCGAKARPALVPSGQATFGFVPASHLLSAERDLQWVGNEPHCILRIVLAEAQQGGPVYVEAPREWCNGVD